MDPSLEWTFKQWIVFAVTSEDFRFVEDIYMQQLIHEQTTDAGLKIIKSLLRAY